MTTRIPVLARCIAIATLVLASSSGCGLDSHSDAAGTLAGYQSDVSEIQVISAVVGGKNIFIPSTIVVSAGKPQALSIFNTADKPHGFTIRGLSIEIVLMPGEETRVVLPDLKGSEIYTIIEVDTRDRPGLLFDLTRTLAVNNIYIASAVIATYGAQVVDTFYVKDMFGLKLHQKHRQEALERKLRQAIAEGAERAGA